MVATDLTAAYHNFITRCLWLRVNLKYFSVKQFFPFISYSPSFPPSFSPSFSVSLFLSLYISLSVSLCFSVSVCLSVSLLQYFYFLSLSFSVYLYFPLYFSLFVSLLMSFLSLSLSLFLLIYSDPYHFNTTAITIMFFNNRINSNHKVLAVTCLLMLTKQVHTLNTKTIK